MAHSRTQARDDSPPRWGRRLGWLLLIWVVSVLTLGVVARAFHLVMKWVGLTG